MDRSFTVELTGDEVDAILTALEDTWQGRLRLVSQSRRGELRLKYVALFEKLGRLLAEDEHE
jgi:hypothetical protein